MHEIMTSRWPYTGQGVPLVKPRTPAAAPQFPDLPTSDTSTAPFLKIGDSEGLERLRAVGDTRLSIVTQFHIVLEAQRARSVPPVLLTRDS